MVAGADNPSFLTDFPHGIFVVFPGNNPADSTSRIISIPLVPGDEMAVAVHDSLAGCIAYIIPNIITVRFEIILNDGLAFFNELNECQLLFRYHGKIVRCMPEWHYQQVSL